MNFVLFYIFYILGRRLEQAVSAAARFEQIPGGGLGQERKGNTGERGRNQGFEEVARNHFQPVKGQVRVRVWSMLNKYFDVPHLSMHFCLP